MGPLIKLRVPISVTAWYRYRGVVPGIGYQRRWGVSYPAYHTFAAYHLPDNTALDAPAVLDYDYGSDSLVFNGTAHL